MIILGIDPGLSGGIALVASNGGLFAADIPTTGEKAKRRVDVPAVIRTIRSGVAFLRACTVTDNLVPDHAFIERAQAMPEQGATSGFIYGRAVGSLEACIEAMAIPHTVIESTAWKKSHGLIKRGKEDSRQRALKLFPRAADHSFFARRKDHNRAEAALIAWYGMMLLSGLQPRHGGLVTGIPIPGGSSPCPTSSTSSPPPK